jgi:quercetin dioxygenase-like cupin family protein/alkylhydroperoxidase/carboxymuconolactone decarboxylase family protein YurZ
LGKTFELNYTRKENTMNIFKRSALPLFVAVLCLMNITKAMAETDTTLNDRQKSIIPIAALTANGNMSKLETALNQGLDNGLTVNEIKEILIHIYAYAGFPRALNGINTFMSVTEDRKAQGKIDIEGPKATPLPSEYDPNAYGHKVRNTLVGRDISNRKNGYPVFTPIIDTFLVEHLFADIFVRDVLSHQVRELVTISTLAAMAGTEPQLKGHLGIAMRIGYSEAQLKDYITVLKDKVGIDVAQRANRVLGDVLGKSLSAVGPKAVKVTRKTAPVNGSSDYFTGDATIESRFTSEATNSYGGGIVNFKAGSRTAWHTHPFGQSLVVISGRGRVQSEGDPVQEILPGDVVWIPGNERHWHGAAPDSAMSHVAISEPLNGSTVQWMEHVNEAQYIK